MIRQLLICFCLCCFILSCRKEKASSSSVTARFFVKKLDPVDEYPVKLKFLNASQGATSYLWDFGDGTISTLDSPEVAFYASGRYKVKLLARNGADTNSVTWTVTVPYLRNTVAILYIIPKDLKFDLAIYNGIKSSMPGLQEWYRQQLGGKSFKFNTPLLDTIMSQQNYSWFHAGDAFHNAMSEAQKSMKDAINVDHQLVLIFLPVDAQQANIRGQGGIINFNGISAGGVIYEDPTLEIAVPIAVSAALRTVGHELGHAFGLQHNTNGASIMLSGEPPYVGQYLYYPNCVLLDYEKELVRKSQFIF